MLLFGGAQWNLQAESKYLSGIPADSISLTNGLPYFPLLKEIQEARRHGKFLEIYPE